MPPSIELADPWATPISLARPVAPPTAKSSSLAPLESKMRPAPRTRGSGWPPQSPPGRTDSVRKAGCPESGPPPELMASRHRDPTRTSPRAPRSISATTWPRRAPSAIRTPISLVRHPGVVGSNAPYNPIATPETSDRIPKNEVSRAIRRCCRNWPATCSSQRNESKSPADWDRHRSHGSAHLQHPTGLAPGRVTTTISCRKCVRTSAFAVHSCTWARRRAAPRAERRTGRSPGRERSSR
jgi:hypothetical protein